MCGIVGSVGASKDPIKSYSLMTNLLRETKRRGRHATGYFSVGTDGQVMTHKAPVCSDTYIKSPYWKQNIVGTKALIGHCRWTTHGSADKNENNHPFLSKSGNMALVHNGIIFGYDDLKDEYKASLESECDSELILRVICREKDPIAGIKKAYELLGPGGDFACELIHVRKDGKVMFYFFRDDGRPGKIIDAREELGQFLFCSEVEIWRDAVLKSGMARSVRQLRIADIDPYKIVAVEANSMKSRIIEVEKPKKVVRVTRTVTHYGGVGGTRYIGEDDEYGDNWYGRAYGSGRQYSGANTSVGSSVSSVSSVGKRLETTNCPSVLDKHWIETKNERGLPRFVYDPDRLIGEKKAAADDNTQEIVIRPQEDDVSIAEMTVPIVEAKIEPRSEDEKDFYREQLAKIVVGETEGWPGWEDEALENGVIDQDEYNQFVLKQKAGSEDALDHTIDRSNLDIGDLIDIPTLKDETRLGELLTQQSDDDFLKQYE